MNVSVLIHCVICQLTPAVLDVIGSILKTLTATTDICLVLWSPQIQAVVVIHNDLARLNTFNR